MTKATKTAEEIEAELEAKIDEKPDDEKPGSDDGTGTGLDQEAVNKLVGEARIKGRSSGQAELLTTLGVETVEELTAMLDAAKALEAEKLTEAERIQKELDDIKEKYDAAQKVIADKEAADQVRAMGEALRAEARKEEHKINPSAIENILVLASASADTMGLIEKTESGFSGLAEAVKKIIELHPYIVDTAGKEKLPGKKIGKLKSEQVEIKDRPLHL